MIGAVHNGSVTFWSSGGTASAGVEAVAELGTTGTFKSEINANMNAATVFEQSIASGGTATATVDIVVTTDHPRVTLLSMVAPSPDWFVGVSGLSLLDAQGDWLTSHSVDLFPYDAGTEEGTEFSLNNTATDPQGTISSIKGTGKFSNEPIASLTFTLQSVTPEITSAATFTVDEGTTAVETLTAKDQDSAAADLEWSKAGGADAGQFTLSSGGELTFTTAPDYENPGDADGDNVYKVTVQVSDGDNTDTKDVVVTVKNMDEDGTVSLFPASLRVRTVVRPTLSDPDGGISAVAWQWARSSDEINWADIDGAVQADYLPTHSDKVQYLRATARYTDGEGAGKTAVAASEATVGAREPGPELSVKTLVSGLRYPWGIAFTPDGTMLFTERDGHRQQDPLPDPPEGLSSRLTDGTLQTVSANFSDLDTDENGGVMGLEVDPDFVDNRRIYICQQRTGSVIQVVAWTIDATYTTATRANDPLVGNIPRVDNHNGCRLRFGPDGNLWISTGDTEAIGTVPQDLNSLGGKILRVDPLTGAAPADNPFLGSLVYSYGHRNPQGLALRPGTRQMWSVEHGPTVDDEINLLVPGANYGWDPVPTDENGDPTSGYDDTAPMTDLVKFPGAIEARWSSGNPTLATSGGIFLEGEQWGLWEGRLAVATLKGRSLRIFEFTEDGTFVSHVVPEELDHFGDRDHRLRTPMIGPDNALYLSTSTRGWRDEILRVTPQQAPEFPNDVDTRQVTENTGGDMVVATVEATDYNHDELTYTLGGTDGESFYILDENIGELRVRSTTQLDYETRREYEVTVTATDAQDTSDTVTLTIEVTDVEHEGTVSLPLTQPRVGSPVQASLSDPDGGVTGTTWQWERSDDGVTGWEDIDGARSASYTPGTDDIGKYLRATVTYTNIHGPGKTAQSVTSSAVSAAPNSNPEFPSASVVRRVAEHTAAGQPFGSRVEADDGDGDPLQYALSGGDGNLFSINRSSGQLLTRAALDYEMANEYEVDVSVSDGKDTNAVSDDNKVDDSVRVTIEVTNVDEPGSVSLLPAQLRVWTVVRATLSDPDGVDLHAVSWQWAASSDGVSWMPVPAPEGTQADYAPTDIVQGQYLRATASYTDGQGTGKRAEVVSDNVVGERESGPELTVVPLVSGLSVPWGVAFAPDGTMLFTERGDRLSSRLTDGTVQSVSADFGDLLVSGEAGLMAIVVDPAFASNRRFYTCQAHTGPEVQVIAWTLNATYTAATRADDPLVGNIPATSRHSGCRLRFGPEGYLWIATGDASAGTVPQDRNSLGGKVLRVNSSTGAAAPGNPFGTRVYTYGHRNPQGLARRPGTNQMWSVEHGPTVDDEINLLSSGGNYGWDPVPGYNESVPMTDLGKFPDAVEARWSSGDPTLATSGGIFLEGADWEEWNGRLAIATLKGRSLRVFEFSASGVFMSHVVAPGLDGAYGRLRTPMLGPDGALYVTTSNGRGQDKILRVSGSRAPAFLTDTETRKVDENNDISTFVAKVLALDSDGDTLTYTLSGPDAESFSIPDDTVGAMWANVAFDYETKRSYEVTVTATDPQGLNDSTTLTITVTDTDEPPVAPGAPMVSARTGTTDSLDVVWIAPDNAGKPGIESYDLRYRKGEGGASTNGPQDQTTTSATITGLQAGSAYQVQVRATNNEGDSPWSVAGTGQTDAPPAVISIEITSNPGSDRTYAAGDEIGVTVTFSETVEVEGSPQLSLELGGGIRTATYEGGSGTAALVFAYKVADGESDTDGVGIEADSLSGGTIRDEAHNNAELDHDGLAADSGHKVDAVKPQLAATGGAVVDGATLTLTYGELLDGSSTLAAGDFTVSGGDQARAVSNAAVSGSAVALTLDPAVEHGETAVTVSYTPGTNPIRDVAGNEAEALSRVPVSNETPDTTAPRVISLAISSNPGSDQAYAAGDEIEVTVTFSETVVVEGTPQLRLRVGARTRTASYQEASGTAALVFGYEVAEGDEDTGGVSIEAGRITLNGGTIKDEADNPAELAHEAVAAQAGHKVDGVRPVFVSAAVDGSSLTLTYGETLDGGSRPAPGDFTVEVDGAGRSVTGVSVSGSVVTLTLSTAVEHEDTGIRVSYTPGTNPIRDVVGNDARGLSNQAVTNTTGEPNTAPEITTVGPFTVRENQALVSRLAARDDDSGDEVTGWSIIGGADQTQFSITSDTGDLSFQEAPDYESPTDVVSGDPPSGAGDNEYVVTVEVRSGTGVRELEAEQTFTVRVTDEREPPGIPEAPAFSEETADSLRVRWREPDNSGPPITDYDVRYRKKGPGPFIDAQHMGPGLSLTLDDLEPGTAYEVQVRATNDEGSSDWSESGEGMTVTPLTVEMMGGTEPPVEGPFTVRFSFSEPVRGFTQAAIETAQDPACTDEQNNPVFCEPDIGRLETVDDRVFNTTVTPQTDRVAHNYTLTLTVSGGAVRSSVGNKLNEEAMLGGRVAPPGVTVPISEIGLTASGLDRAGRLNWNRPANDEGSPIIRYEYRYAPVGEVWNDWENVGARAVGVTVGNLVNGLEYVFEVRAVNALGKGPVETAAATPVLRTGPPPPPPPPGPRQTVPDAPTNLLADGGNEQVALSWEAPENDGGFAITDYEVRINGRGSWISIGSTHTTHTVTGLTNGTVYVFQVRAVNAAGSSPYSNRAEATPGVGALDFAHFANGAGIISDLVFVNVATHPIRLGLYFYDKEGHLIDPESMVDLTEDLEVTEDGALSIRTEMEPLGELTISTHGRGEVMSGSVQVAADGPIGGVLRFDLPGIGVAGVGASQPVRDALFPARRQAGGIATAAAIRNLGEEALVVSCRLMSGGIVLEAVEISLEANGQEARYIEELFTGTDTSDFVGSVRCTAPGLFTGIAVELDDSNRIFTTLPVVPVARTGGRGQGAGLDFAHFANGDGIVSGMVFVNLSTQPSGPGPTPFHTVILPTRPVLYFYDKGGNLIDPESVVDLTGDLEVTEDGALSIHSEMGPLEELTISTHGRGEVVTGSVTVISEGPIGGVLRFDLPGIGVAGVGASQPVRDAIFPARRQADGISTAAAIHNLREEPMVVSCQLMKDGTVLEEEEIPLEA